MKTPVGAEIASFKPGLWHSSPQSVNQHGFGVQRFGVRQGVSTVLLTLGEHVPHPTCTVLH
jgi:hypothetical protein